MSLEQRFDKVPEDSRFRSALIVIDGSFCPKESPLEEERRRQLIGNLFLLNFASYFYSCFILFFIFVFMFIFIFLLLFLKGKEGETGYRYLLIVRSVDAHVLEFYGPFQAASNDLTLLHASGLMNILKEWERVIADGIFRGAFFFGNIIRIFSVPDYLACRSRRIHNSSPSTSLLRLLGSSCRYKIIENRLISPL